MTLPHFRERQTQKLSALLLSLGVIDNGWHFLEKLSLGKPVFVTRDSREILFSFGFSLPLKIFPPIFSRLCRKASSTSRDAATGSNSIWRKVNVSPCSGSSSSLRNSSSTFPHITPNSVNNGRVSLASRRDAGGGALAWSVLLAGGAAFLKITSTLSSEQRRKFS